LEPFYEMWMLQSLELHCAICTCVSLCKVPLWCFFGLFEVGVFLLDLIGVGRVVGATHYFCTWAKFLLRIDSIPLTLLAMCVEYVLSAKPLISRLLFVRLYCFTTSKSMYHKSWKNKLQ
jgi:hypothetical protein